VPAKIAGLAPSRFSGTSSWTFIASKATSTARKLTALAAKQKPGPKAATITPPIAGPTTRAALNSDELSAIALGSSAGPTIWYVNACRAGASNTSTMPRTTASTYTCHGWMVPSSVSSARSVAVTMAAACVVITSRRGSRRSAKTPAKRPSTLNGMNWQRTRMPTATGDPVSSSTSHAIATFCIQVPVTEVIWPMKKSR
jgi:hypothetical protein